MAPRPISYTHSWRASSSSSRTTVPATAMATTTATVTASAPTFNRTKRATSATVNSISPRARVITKPKQPTEFQKQYRMAQQGNVSSQLWVGDQYYQGTNTVGQNYAKAWQWYQLALRKVKGNGNYDNTIPLHVTAALYFRLGRSHEHGNGGVQRDWNKATEYYELAADYGDKDAQKRLSQESPRRLEEQEHPQQLQQPRQ